MKRKVAWSENQQEIRELKSEIERLGEHVKNLKRLVTELADLSESYLPQGTDNLVGPQTLWRGVFWRNSRELSLAIQRAREATK